MKVILLAGGLGTRLSEETKIMPKPLVKIGKYPILIHIMKIYSFYGFKDFIICGGYKFNHIKKFFKNYSDLKIVKKENNQDIFFSKRKDWKINLVFTGHNTNTGGRLLKIKKLIKKEKIFLLTYGDGLADVNIKNLLKYHIKNKKLATVTAVRPPGRFGVLNIKNGKVKNFQEKVDNKDSWINGGFFVFNKEIFKYLKKSSDSLEQNMLNKIAKKNQLSAFQHNKFWLPMDTLRDKTKLNDLYRKGNAPWILTK